jgi:hypothetical protein
MRSREKGGSLTPPSPNSAPDFAHHNGNELYFPGAKSNDAQAVQAVYGEDTALFYHA